MKKTIKRIIASLLVVIMVFGSAPLEVLTGLDLASLFGVKAEAKWNGVYYPKGATPKKTITVNTSNSENKYDADWEYWSQGASQYVYQNGKGYMKSGCRIVAYSKLLMETGIAPSGFNPDVLMLWGRKNGYVTSTSIGEQKNAGTGQYPIDYAKSLGNNGLTYKRIDFKTTNIEEQARLVYEQILAGKYVIVCISEGATNHHYSYASREYSLEAGTAILSDSSSSYSVNEC